MSTYGITIVISDLDRNSIEYDQVFLLEAETWPGALAIAAGRIFGVEPTEMLPVSPTVPGAGEEGLALEVG